MGKILLEDAFALDKRTDGRAARGSSHPVGCKTIQRPGHLFQKDEFAYALRSDYRRGLHCRTGHTFDKMSRQRFFALVRRAVQWCHIEALLELEPSPDRVF